MDNQSIIYRLFVKYIEGKCSPEEIRQLLLYFDLGEDETILRSLIKAELAFDNEVNGLREEDAAIRKVKTSLFKKIKGRRQNRMGQNWMSIAAISFVLITSAFFVLFNYSKNFHKLAGTVQFQHAITHPGELKMVRLFDGTKIWLSPSSSLEYPSQLIGKSREVKLEGEAFFEVTKDKNHPFIIHSDRMDTRVVGTSFNIQSYKGDSRYAVTVVTGIVKVSGYTPTHKKQSEVILKPNQQSNLNLDNNSLEEGEFPDAAKMLRRKDGILTYNGTLVTDVAHDLSRYYNTRISVESKSKNCLCYGEFDSKRPLNIVLEQLAAAISARVIVQKNGMILKGGCEE